MGFTTLQVVAVRVVYGMASGPAVVGNQQGAVQNKSDCPFNSPVGVKSVVATFVSQDPAPHGNCACDRAIDNQSGMAAGVSGMVVPTPTAAIERPTDITRFPRL